MVKMASPTDIDDTVLAKFAQRLAANETRIRNKSVKKLRRWMQNRSKAEGGGFTEMDLIKLWKGLHYCMWMSDKPLVQEDLADMLSGLIHCFNNVDTALRFVSAFFQTQAREWYGIDRLRIDKFMMLVRRFLRQTFVLLKLRQWEADYVQRVASVLATSVIKPNSDDVIASLTRHVADIFVSELIEVDASDMSTELVMTLLDPFLTFIQAEKNSTLGRAVMKSVFFPLVDIRMDQMGNEEAEDEEDEEQPPLKIDWSKLSCRLMELGSSKRCLARNRKMIYSMVKTCDNLAKGVLPEEEQLDISALKQERLNIKDAVSRLISFETKMLEATGSKQNKRKRKRNDVKESEEEKMETGEGEEEEEEEDEEEEEEEEEELITSPVKKKKKVTKPSQELDSPVSKKQKNKKKQKSITENNSQNSSLAAVTKSSETVEVEEEPSNKKKSAKKRANKKKHVKVRNSNSQTVNGHVGALFSDPDSDSPLEDGEVEILIPNKKYNGPQKEGFLNKVKASLSSPVMPSQETVESEETQAKSSSGKKKKKKSKVAGNNSFASFDGGVTPPAAFVKRAMAKVTPKHKVNGTKKKEDAMTPVTPGDKKKRVSFHLANNTSQDFNDSLTLSPALPFDPKIFPDRTILKSPAIKPLSIKKRLKAADFF